MALDIPEWKALSLDGIDQIPQLYQAARKASVDTEAKKHEMANADRKLSADLARQQYEQDTQAEALKHARGIETAGQLLPGSDLFRAANISAGLGNQVGEPYGIKVGETVTKTNAPDGATPSPAEGAQFLQSGGQHVEPGLQGPTPEGPSLGEDPLLNFKPPTMAPETSGELPPPAAPAPGINPDAEIAPLEAALPETRHMYAEIRGQRFDIPKEGGASLFEEPKYNTMYDKLVNEGMKDKDAVAQVERIRRADIGEGGKTSRFTATLGQKQNVQLTREEQLAKEHDILGQSDANSRRAANAHILGDQILAGRPVGGSSQADPKMLSALNARMSQLARFTKPITDLEGTYDTLLHDVDSGAVPLQQNEAAVLNALLVRKRVSDAEMKYLYDNIGGANDAFDRFYHNTIGGNKTPEQLRQLQAATAALANSHKMMVNRAKVAIDHGLNDATFSGIPNETREARNVFYGELGMPMDEGASQGAAPAAGPAPAHHAPAHRQAGGDDAQAIKWAHANPGDPRAKKILQLHGM